MVPSVPQNCLKRVLRPNTCCYLRQLTEHVVLVRVVSDSLRVESDRVQHVVRDVILPHDVKVLPEVGVDLFEPCPLDEEGEEEPSALLEDGMSLPQECVLILIIEEALDVDDHVDAMPGHVDREVLRVALDELGRHVVPLRPLLPAELDRGSADVQADRLMWVEHRAQVVQAPAATAAGVQQNLV